VGKFLHANRAERGGFYGTALRWRNAEAEVRDAAFSQRSVLALARAPETEAAAVRRGNAHAAPAAAGGEAGQERRC